MDKIYKNNDGVRKKYARYSKNRFKGLKRWWEKAKENKMFITMLFVMVLLIGFIVVLFAIRPIVNFYAPYEIDEIDYTDIEGDVIIEDGLIYINKTLQWTYTDQFNYGSESYINTTITSDGFDIENQIIGDPVESNVSFTTPSNYDYNATNVVVSGGVAKLKAIESGSTNFPFTTPSNYTYNATKIEVIDGVAKLKGVGIYPYAWWHLNHTGTDDTAVDSSGNGLDGTLINMEVADWDTVNQKLGTACLDFDGVNEVVSAGNIASFERTDSFSLEFWFKTSSDLSGYVIAGKINSVNGIGYYAYIGRSADDSLYFKLANSQANRIYVRTTAKGFADNIWHHGVCTYDGSSDAGGVHVYVDGNDEPLTVHTNTLSNSIINGADFRIAGMNDYTYHFDGEIDEVVIYDQEISQSDVTARYNSGNGTEYVVGAYSMDNPDIYPNSSYTFIQTLDTFTETATKPSGSELKYQISSNNGTTWKWFNGTAWDTITGGQTDTWYYNNEVNLATVIDTNIGSLASSGIFRFRAFLHSDAGITRPELSNIYIAEGVSYPLGYHLITMDYDIQPVSVLNWLNLTETVTKPTGTNIAYTYSIDGGSSYNTTWFTEPELETAIQRIITICEGSDKIRFKFRLSTTDEKETPIIDNLSIFNEQGYESNGTYMCGEFSLSTYRYIIWKTISIEITTPSGTTLLIYTATSGGVLSPEGQWELRNDGDVLNVPASPESIFFQWYAVFTATGKITPTLHSIEITYWEYILNLD